MSTVTQPSAAEIAALNSEYTFFDWSAQDSVKALAIDRAEGVYLIDHDGRRILDFNAQLMNVNLGHQHPSVVAAIKAQADRLCYVNPKFATQPRGELGRELAQITPGSLCKSFFTLGGSEATDHAIKVARLATGKQKIVARRRSYHGATYGAITLTGEARRWATEPGIPGVVRAADPYQYRCRFCSGQNACDQRCADDIDEVIRVEGPDHVAAVIVEPIAGANGVIIPPDGYLQRVREICTEYDVLLIADEVMSGFGRTGRWFAVEHWNVEPDIMTVSKGLTSGTVPLGAVIVSEEIARHFDGNRLWAGLTYGAHTLACAAALATIQAYRDEGIPERVVELGQILTTEYAAMAERHPSIGEGRSLGLFSALELVKNRETREPIVPQIDPAFEFSGVMRELSTFMLEHGVSTMTRWNWVFINPPLTITEDELRSGLKVLDAALDIADQAIT
ncbi:MAG: aminotransferase class III-fold pyridoxal phosphate-dependent enzyme [Pirellulaceae bacterium]|nr:aminotransferase class III-fold pyridoxal phosphate-dependent enzyme [Pirellulaceae bacterium]